jgi:hypothetical protein
MTESKRQRVSPLPIRSAISVLSHDNLESIFAYLCRLAIPIVERGPPSYTMKEPIKLMRSICTDTLSVCKEWKQVTEMATMPLCVFDPRNGSGHEVISPLINTLESIGRTGFSVSHLFCHVNGRLVDTERVALAAISSHLTHFTSGPNFTCDDPIATLERYPKLRHVICALPPGMVTQILGDMLISIIDKRNGSWNGRMAGACARCDKACLFIRCNRGDNCTIETDRVCQTCSGLVPYHTHPHYMHDHEKCTTPHSCAPCPLMQVEPPPPLPPPRLMVIAIRVR